MLKYLHYVHATPSTGPPKCVPNPNTEAYESSAPLCIEPQKQSNKKESDIANPWSWTFAF